MPNECDARIRNTWFWNTHNAKTLKSVDELMEMYYQSVGHGAVLLLNHTPDTTGKIPESDVRRGAEFGAEIKRRFGQSLAETSGDGEVVELQLPKAAPVDHVITMEQILDGERVREYVLEGWAGDKWQTLCQGTAIGYKKIDRFSPTVVSKIRFRCLKSAAAPRLGKLAAYSVHGAAEPPKPPAPTPVGR